MDRITLKRKKSNINFKRTRAIQFSVFCLFLDRYCPYGAWEVEGLFFYTDTAPTELKEVERMSFEISSDL